MSSLNTFLRSATDDTDSKINSTKVDDILSNYTQNFEKHAEYIENTIEIQPNCGFVCKAQISINNNKKKEKVFINVCSHFRIAPIHMTSDTEMRIPVSSGSVHWVTDARMNEVRTFDVVFNPKTVTQSVNDSQFKIELCSIAVQNIMKKSKIEYEKSASAEYYTIYEPFKFPKSNYKGKGIHAHRPLPQRVDKKRASKAVQMEDISIVEQNENMENVEQRMKSNIKHSLETVLEEKNEGFFINANINHCKFIVLENGRKTVFHSLDVICHHFENMNEVRMDLESIEFCLEMNIKENQSLSDLELITNVDGLQIKMNDENCLSINNSSTVFAIHWRDIYYGLWLVLNEDGITAKYVVKKNMLKIKCPVLMNE